MTPELLAAAITLLLGPGAFFLISRRQRVKPFFPVTIYDGIGDIILLPLFNALAIHYGILALLLADYQKLAIAVGIAYIASRIFMIYRKDFAKHDDWSRPKRGTYSLGGWWRQGLLFVQAFVIIITMLHLNKLLLWALLVLSVLMFARSIAGKP